MLDNFKAYHLRGKDGKSGPLEGSTIWRRTICEGNMEKESHLIVRQFQIVPFARETWKKYATWGFDNFKVFHLRGKHGKTGPLECWTILRRTICEGKMEKVGLLRVRQFQGVPFARETWEKWATWGFDNFMADHLRLKHLKSGPLEGSTISRRTIYEGNMEKVDQSMVRQFLGIPFAIETFKKWTTWSFDNFKSYHLRGKHGKSGPLEGSTISRRTICEGNIWKVGHLRVRQFHGRPFAIETFKKWSTWGFDNFEAYHLRGKTWKKWANRWLDNF